MQPHGKSLYKASTSTDGVQRVICLVKFSFFSLPSLNNFYAATSGAIRVFREVLHCVASRLNLPEESSSETNLTSAVSSTIHQYSANFNLAGAHVLLCFWNQPLQFNSVLLCHSRFFTFFVFPDWCLRKIIKSMVLIAINSQQFVNYLIRKAPKFSPFFVFTITTVSNLAICLCITLYHC